MEPVQSGPGPIDASVLTEQDNHVSTAIWHGREPGVYRCIPANPKKGFWKLNERQCESVRLTGLHHLSQISHMRIDHSLISALVERWRPETNTFHFQSGEATITLEDVAYIYGLPIDGPPIIGRTYTKRPIIEEVCNSLLGRVPNPTDIEGGQLKLTWFHKNFVEAPENASEENLNRHTRAYLFCLVASQVCGFTSGSRGPAYLLELFKIFQVYAWAPACLANLYRTLSKATRLKDGIRTICGALQLLQIWAYSRMKIGRPIKQDMESIKFEFPLFKMWEKRLKNHFWLTTVEEARQQLDQQGIDQFEWQPYTQFAEELFEYVSEGDSCLFTTCSYMIFYSIAEPHNADRVMKQFGLRQIVPPPLHPAPWRDEKSSSVTTDYGVKLKEQIDAWNNRVSSVINAECDDLVGRHSDEYFAWYHQITRMRVGRPKQGRRNIQYEYAIQQMEAFLKHVVATVDSVDEKYDSWFLYKIMQSIQQQCLKFSSACSAGFENYSLEECINTGSYENWQGENQEDESGQVPNDVHTSQPSPFTSSIPKPHGAPLVTPMDTHKSSPFVGPIPTSLPLPFVPSSSTEMHSSFTPSPTPQPSPFIPSFSTPQHSIFITTSPTPQSVPFVIPTQTAQPPPIYIPSPTHYVSSMVGRVKGNPRKRIVPPRLSPYLLCPKSKRARPNPQYSLTPEEENILDKFWISYHKNIPELTQICSRVSAESLRQCLRQHWIDTNIMDCWFEILESKCKTVHFFPSSLAHWEQNKSEDYYSIAFGKEGIRKLNEYELWLFPIWHQSHFFLIVGYPKRERWEFYNSLDNDADWAYTRHFG